MIDKILSLENNIPLDLIVTEPRRAIEVTFQSISEGILYFTRRTEIAHEDLYIDLRDIFSIGDCSIEKDESRFIIFARTAKIVKLERV